MTLIARVGIAWALLGVVETTVFAIWLAPHLGDTFTFESRGKRGPIAMHFDTTSFAVVGIVSASIAAAATVIER